MMYGRTLYGRLSCFVRDELPVELTVRDVPRREPPKRTSYFSPYKENTGTSIPVSGELSRRPSVTGFDANKRGAEKFGVEKLGVGDRVLHAIFGEGSILSTRDMGGDVLYEVRFDNGQTKKLMATFAKLKKI
jgi:DNA helicase-2/ATP-dependent DNA helicase PcrA